MAQEALWAKFKEENPDYDFRLVSSENVLARKADGWEIVKQDEEEMREGNQVLMQKKKEEENAS